ncbi:MULTISPECIES: aromatic ring-hydroxylating dioxygenase subunit alpha [Nostoc]|uniref:Aromatic ring-hydroxylating dioxygenase subunit alpha n=2 Tax=Nostoc TaxID=1177 RepID=A0ABR8IIC4_9NOSO|nr:MULTISPECIES: aromatic ring-hydroxylating dioxygenase subunit alpha [Nostoc]MBD2565512.1 aromatic ring-hydroxylating dioxygenase subunit alpha [Nostoc linckia FACHB-391]MBD2651262.1 aromatic ring-hydroxylating dioxygenase subunit alpha [Nostoc foliaceum FACHB-393]
MGLKNFWYVAESSSAITNKPKHISMLGEEFVLYRNSKNQVVALSNLCVHRGGFLADGQVEGDCIRCPYHGWKYAANGAAVEIPANKPQTPIPKLAHIDAYPVEEKYGWVWLFLGDLPEAERPPLPLLPEFGDSTWRAISGTFKWNAPYTRVVENGLDISHLPFVHGFEPQILESSEVNLSSWSGSLFVNLKPSPSKGLWKYFTRHKGGASVEAKATFYMPNVTRQDIHLPGKSKLILFGVHVPIDDRTTITWWMQLRNFLTYFWADSDAQRRNLRAFLQDQRVVEAQRPELLPYNLAMRSDALQIAYRQLHQKYLDMGWGVKQHRIKSGDSGIQTVVIPSPIRRQIPELAKAWERKEGGSGQTHLIY